MSTNVKMVSIRSVRERNEILYFDSGQMMDDVANTGHNIAHK